MKRDRPVQTTLTKDEYTKLLASAAFHNRSVADYIRLCVLENVNKDWVIQRVVVHPETNGDPKPSQTLDQLLLQRVLTTVAQGFTDDNMDPDGTYWRLDNPGDKIAMPCHPIGHLLLAVQNGIFQKGWYEDAARWLMPVADPETTRALCQAMWPTHWLELIPDHQLEPGQEVINDHTLKGMYFKPSAKDAKAIFMLLAKGTSLFHY